MIVIVADTSLNVNLGIAEVVKEVKETQTVGEVDKTSALVPIGYNKDKTGKPCNCNGFRICPYSFSTEKAPEIGV